MSKKEKETNIENENDAKKTDKTEKKNKKEKKEKKEKSGRPNNLLIAIIIVVSLGAIFGGVFLYNYYQQPASIEAYMETLGGADSFSNIQLTDNSTAKITADKNKMKIVINDNSEDKDGQVKYYKSKKGVKELKYVSGYYLYYFKSSTRGLTASVKTTVYVQGEKVKTIEMTYREAKKYLKEVGAIE